MKRFSYSDLFLDSANIVLSYKFTWLLGLLAALNGSKVISLASSSRSSLSGNSSFTYLGSYFSNFSRLAESWNTNGTRFIIASVMTLLLGIGLWLVGFVGQASLIKAAFSLNQNKDVTLRKSLRDGLRFLVPMIGVTLVLFGPYLLVSFLFGRVLSTDGTSFPVLYFLLAFLVLFPIGLIVATVHPLAQRAIVLQGQSVTASIRHGWQFLRENLKKLIIIMLILALIVLIYGALLSFILMPLASKTVFPALFEWIETGSISTGEIASIIVFSLMGLALGAPINAYRSITITLAYSNLGGLGQTRKKRKKR